MDKPKRDERSFKERTQERYDDWRTRNPGAPYPLSEEEKEFLRIADGKWEVWAR